jgi:glycosyltransferase involved in cell wall biosynthesis
MLRYPVSVLLLTRNEAGRLERLLSSLRFAEQVVVVDDASTDDTARIAERCGAQVTVRPLEEIGGFGPQRQFALDQCTQPWVLWIDADERLDERALAALTHAVAGDLPGAGTIAGYSFERHTWFLGRRIRWCGWRGERVTRLFRRAAARFDDAPVHERVHLTGPVAPLPGVLEHHSYENWQSCRTKLVQYARAGAEARRRAGRSAGILDVALRPAARFVRMYLLQAGLLDGAHGFAVCALAATQVFLREMELWADRPPGR